MLTWLRCNKNKQSAGTPSPENQPWEKTSSKDSRSLDRQGHAVARRGGSCIWKIYIDENAEQLCTRSLGNWHELAMHDSNHHAISAKSLKHSGPRGLRGFALTPGLPCWHTSSMFPFGGAFCLFVFFFFLLQRQTKKKVQTWLGQPYDARISCLTEHVVEALHWWSLLDLAFHKHIIGQKLQTFRLTPKINHPKKCRHKDPLGKPA